MVYLGDFYCLGFSDATNGYQLLGVLEWSHQVLELGTVVYLLLLLHPFATG